VVNHYARLKKEICLILPEATQVDGIHVFHNSGRLPIYPSSKCIQSLVASLELVKAAGMLCAANCLAKRGDEFRLTLIKGCIILATKNEDRPGICRQRV
jgi:hypothetical protein